jgi:uncharacterized protein (TIGR02145 family)
MNKVKFIFLVASTLLAMAFTLSCSDDGTLTDPRDGKVYKTVKIGTQIWMAENLNYDGSENKDKVVLALKNRAVQYDGDGRLGICYDNNSANCEKYGRLYDWAEAMGSNFSGIHSSYNFSETGLNDKEHKGICPEGWHLPSRSEWEDLYDYIGGDSYSRNKVDDKLKAKNGWKNNGTDDYKFSAAPGGYRLCGSQENEIGNRILHCKEFALLGNAGYWWTATEAITAWTAKNWLIEEPEIDIEIDKMSLHSVRCVKNKK